MRLSDFDPSLIKSLLSELQAEATGFVRTCDADAPILTEFKVYMRYSGQGWEIPIELTAEQALNPDVNTFQQRFEQDYASLFGRTVEGMDVEITGYNHNQKAMLPVLPVDAQYLTPCKDNRSMLPLCFATTCTQGIPCKARPPLPKMKLPSSCHRTDVPSGSPMVASTSHLRDRRRSHV